LKLDGTNFATYTYDVADRLTKITNSADAKAVSYTYDNANRMTKETLPNTIATTFDYDGMNRLKRIKDTKGTATSLFDRNYTYNTANQISQIAETAQTRNFGYDNLDRLTSVSGSTTENYAFDAVGNRTSSQLSATYNYQPFNRLTNTVTTSYVYNANGNMTQKTNASGTTQYYWDYENRLKQVILPNGQNVVYKYDALGRRSERNVNNSTSWTKFTYDGQDVILDQNSDGTSVTYLNGAGIDNKIRQTVNGQAQYFLSDHLGSTNALTDATGAVIASTSYDSFGNATNANFPTRYQFTGREFDSLTGLQYSRARWYDANLGRFISEDPIGFRGGDVNLYGYVRNKSIKYKDPTGLTPSTNAWFLLNFLTGTGDTARTYQPGSTEFEEMRNSPGVEALRNDFYSHGCKDTEFGYSTLQAYQDTFLHPGDTSFQVGGFSGSARPRENNTVDYRINNAAGAYSFFLHRVNNVSDDSMLFRTIYQDFHWNEPIERCKCHEKVSYDFQNANYKRLIGISLPTQ
jgi:RHS repeat-associated protein